MSENDYNQIQQLQYNITDLKDNYVEEYGSMYGWDIKKRFIFTINADMMLITNMNAFGKIVHPNALAGGLLYNIERIQESIYKGYVAKFGDDMNYLQKHKMIDEIDETVYDFLINGTIIGKKN